MVLETVSDPESGKLGLQPGGTIMTLMAVRPRRTLGWGIFFMEVRVGLKQHHGAQMAVSEFEPH